MQSIGVDIDKFMSQKMQETNLAPPKPEALGKLFGVDVEKKPSPGFKMPSLQQLNDKWKDEYDDEEDSSQKHS